MFWTNKICWLAMKPLVLSFALVSIAFAADMRETDQKTVRAAVEQFNTAAQEGNRAVLDKLLASDVIYGHSNAKIENKQEAVDALAKGKPHFEWKGNYTVNVYGKTAVVHGLAVAHLMTNGKANDVPLDIMQVWVNGGKGWTMVARHTTRRP
jgi:hypothetical protein